MPTNVLGSRLSSLGNLILGGIQKAFRSGVGGQAGVLIPYFGIRVYDPVSGALLIANLPHRTTKVTIRGIQPGNVGATGIGDCSISLFNPEDDEHRKAA